MSQRHLIICDRCGAREEINHSEWIQVKVALLVVPAEMPNLFPEDFERGVYDLCPACRALLSQWIKTEIPKEPEK